MNIFTLLIFHIKSRSLLLSEMYTSLIAIYPFSSKMLPRYLSQFRVLTWSRNFNPDLYILHAFPFFIFLCILF